MTKKTEKNLKHRKIASVLMIAGFVVLFFVIMPHKEASILRSAGLVAAFLLFPASVYFNFKAKDEHDIAIPRKQGIFILIAFLALVAGLTFFAD